MALQVGIDSYVTLAEANEYFAGKLYTSEWDGADDTTKEKALKESCRKINRLAFKGVKVSEAQLLEFPRMMPVLNRIGVIGFDDSEDVPEAVKAAQCEEALALLRYGTSARTRAQEQNVVRVQFGDAVEEYRGPLKLLSREALELLKPYLAGAVNIK